MASYSDDKFSSGISVVTRPEKPRRRQGPVVNTLALVAAIVVFRTQILDLFRGHYDSTPDLHGHNGSNSSHDSPTDFDWHSLPTKPHLSYEPCYNSTYQCARLQLPMDHWNSSTNSTISLAVIRLPAAVPVTHPRYGGAVLINPGGPGGSGVYLALHGGEPIRKTIDADDAQIDGLFYDIIGFDPRGVGNTLPRMHCSANPGFDRGWQVRMMEGAMGSSNAAFARLWAMADAKGRSCSLPSQIGEDGEIRQYVGTAYVARDMVELIEAHGKWREEEAKGLTGDRQVQKGLAWKRDKETLQYWGFSYGTYLGMTFAAMFPDRVHRLVVDGVVDAEDYAKGLWYDNLVDAEKVMDLFYRNCARFGYPACALADEGGDTTTEDIRLKVRNITATLRDNPLPVIGTSPEVITLSDVKNLFFASVYTPQKAFPWVADLLSDLYRGNGTRFAALLKPYHTFTCPATDDSEFVLTPLNNFTKYSPLHQEALMAIACSDGDDLRNTTRENFAQFLNNITDMSPTLGPMWSMVHLHCIHYHVRTKYRFTGPWRGNTSHPLLFLGNTADPVTPLRNAIKFAQGFTGAVALSQDSPGHCSSSTASRCTKRFVRRYFQTGELPEKGTVCAPDEEPFSPGLEGEIAIAEVSEERERASKIWSGIHRSGGGFMRPDIGFAYDSELF